jgi:HEAT repeat protein
MSVQAISLFDKAITQDETQQLEFATKIGQFISTFQTKFIAQEVYPFLATWIPRNNDSIVSALCENIDKFAAIKEAFVELAPVVESLLASEKTKNANTIKQKLLSVKGIPNDSANGFIKYLSSSPIDFVRGFTPSVISLLSSEADIKALFTLLAFDSAFKVRMAVCISIPKLPEVLCNQVAITLLKDSHSRIKAFLPVVCTKQSCYFVALAPTLAADHDWSVRASVAKELINSDDLNEALKFCCMLIEDNVWQVVLCALKSLTILLKRTNAESQTSDFLEKIHNAFLKILSFQQPSLKCAIIDAFIAIYQTTKLDADKVASFVNDIVTNQPPITRLHFINAVVNAKLKQLIIIIRDKLNNVVVSLFTSDQWRIRLGIINSVNAIAELNGEQELKKSLSNLCLQALDDKATPVRIAAAEEFAKFFVEEKSGKLYPDAFLQLKMSDSFRKRQSALTILNHISKFSTKDSKAKIIEEMKYFEKDPCQNVVYLAKDLISKIQ